MPASSASRFCARSSRRSNRRVSESGSVFARRSRCQIARELDVGRTPLFQDREVTGFRDCSTSLVYFHTLAGARVKCILETLLGFPRGECLELLVELERGLTCGVADSLHVSRQPRFELLHGHTNDMLYHDAFERLY